MQASEADVPDNELEDHIVQWPKRVPKKARGREASAELVNARLLW